MSGISVHRFAAAYGALPKLLDVEAEEIQQDGQRLWSLHRRGADRESGALLSPEAVAIAMFFDGTRDLRGIQRAVYERYGQLLYVERLHELACVLNRAGLIDPTARPEEVEEPETTRKHPASAHIAPVNLRPAAHAGSAYARDPSRLRQVLASFFHHPEGPGGLPIPVKAASRLVGIVAPHIDLDRGGPAYAHAYRALAERSDADLFVIFGTAHVSPDELFTLTRRHYDTPLGSIPTDSDGLAILQRELGDRIFQDEGVHDEEHSIEFQAVFLRYLFPHRHITILPVLCSSFYGLAAAKLRPSDEPAVERFLNALAAATRGRKVTYIAAADLSHVGRLYGDAAGPTPAQLQDIERRDLESLKRATDGDADAFYDHVAPDANTRRICGLTPIYMLSRATGGVPGRLVKYAQWHGPKEESAVTYAVLTIDTP
jgi:AmmeMemoRadiSam system protein B